MSVALQTTSCASPAFWLSSAACEASGQGLDRTVKADSAVMLRHAAAPCRSSGAGLSVRHGALLDDPMGGRSVELGRNRVELFFRAKWLQEAAAPHSRAEHWGRLQRSRSGEAQKYGTARSISD